MASSLFVEISVELGGVERILPLGDDKGRNAVADHVRERGTRRHQPIHAEQEPETVEW